MGPPRRDSARRADTAMTRRTAQADTTVQADSAVIERLASLPMLALDPYANTARVEHYVTRFTGPARDEVARQLSVGTKYNAMIREKLRAASIPEEFVYLAMIESGYDPDEVSSVGAVGMWQFMTSTAHDVGMRVDWWIDERRDPVRETDAAVRFLRNLRDQFGSLYLAAAAYNGGPGRVSRGLTKFAAKMEDDEPDDKFFTLASSNALKNETKDYVPQLIAAALIGRDPLRYGIHVDTQPAFTFDSVAVPALTGLKAVALACGTETATIGSMNGKVLRGMIPPGDSPVWLRVPRGCGARFDTALAALSDTARHGAEFRATKKGESPASIAKKAGITVKTLRRYNPKLKTDSEDWIKSGTQILIPDAATVKAARDVPDPSLERTGVAVGNSYTVMKGDTLGKIAERNHTTVSALKRINALKSDVLQIGQKLRVR